MRLRHSIRPAEGNFIFQNSKKCNLSKEIENHWSRRRINPCPATLLVIRVALLHIWRFVQSFFSPNYIKLLSLSSFSQYQYDRGKYFSLSGTKWVWNSFEIQRIFGKVFSFEKSKKIDDERFGDFISTRQILCENRTYKFAL